MCLFRMSVCHKGNFISFILYSFFLQKIYDFDICWILAYKLEQDIP